MTLQFLKKSPKIHASFFIVSFSSLKVIDYLVSTSSSQTLVSPPCTRGCSYFMRGGFRYFVWLFTGLEIAGSKEEFAWAKAEAFVSLEECVCECIIFFTYWDGVQKVIVMIVCHNHIPMYN